MQNKVSFHKVGFLSGKRAAVWAALICLVFAAASCRTIKETEYITVTEYIHDTTEVYVHDTTKVVSVVHDSVDRYVEKVKYVDKDGVVHEKEIERLTLVIRENSEQYHARESEYKNKISELEAKLGEKATEVFVEKKLNWFQKTLMGLGALFIVCIIVCIALFVFGLKKK